MDDSWIADSWIADSWIAEKTIVDCRSPKSGLDQAIDTELERMDDVTKI
jgi:hypothetical protein